MRIYEEVCVCVRVCVRERSVQRKEMRIFILAQLYLSWTLPNYRYSEAEAFYTTIN